MRNINYGNKNAIFGICIIMALWPFGVQVAVSSPESDNAALLYYQAILLRPELDDDTTLHFNRVLQGTQPNEEVRKYLNMKETRETLRIAEVATKVLDCNWGMLISPDGYSYNFVSVVGKVRGLADLFEVDARTLAFDGDYRIALDRCLSIRGLAQHVADEQNNGYLTSLLLHWQACDCIQHILNSMPSEQDTLTWLQSQISTVQGPPTSLGRALEIALEDSIKFLITNQDYLEMIRESLLELSDDESVRQEILSITEEQLPMRAKESYSKYLSSVNRVIGSDIPYQQKHSQLKLLEDEFINEDPIVCILFLRMMFFYAPISVAEQNNVYVRNIAFYNALRAAIEIYLVKAETGQLPEMLPPHLPEDPFSDQDFEYEVTSQGFVLRWREEEIGTDANKLWEFEFNVQSNAENN